MSFLLLGLASAMMFVACSILALSQTKHVVTVLGRGGQYTFGKSVRLVGWGLLAAALVPCLLVEPSGFAILFWLLCGFSAAFAVAMLLAFSPSWLQRPAKYLIRNQSARSF